MSMLNEIEIALNVHDKYNTFMFTDEMSVFYSRAPKYVRRLLAVARAAEAHMNTYDIPLSMMRPTEIALREALAALDADSEEVSK